MRVAVVGATGVLGRALVPQLLMRHNVRALVRTPENARVLFGGQVEAVACDLLAPGIADRLPVLVDSCDAVIHAATAIPKDFNQPGAWEANNRLRTDGTAQLLAACLQMDAEVYIQQSIALAYPDCGDDWIYEDRPLHDWEDGRQVNAAVIEMERQVQAISVAQMRWSILRGGAFVGRDTFQDAAIERLRAGTERIGCDGKAYLALIHVDDMAAAVVAAVERAPAGSIFNVVDEPPRQGDYLDRLAAAVGAPKAPHNSNAPCPLSQRCSAQAARDVLGWQPTHGLMP